jgi:hypothetical protein
MQAVAAVVPITEALQLLELVELVEAVMVATVMLHQLLKQEQRTLAAVEVAVDFQAIS